MKATLHYRCAGQTLVNDDLGRSILEVSVANKIPHWRECGGHGRCTTCRVQILDGLENLTPRTQAERDLAKARGWGTTTRLACQTRATGPVTLERLVRYGDHASQLQVEAVSPVGEERTLAILFCDLRDFTPFAESHNAFDVVHILNRLFTALGEPMLLNGGFIYQYVGDEISGLFGLDGATPESACRAAARAALGMLDSLESLNRTLEGEFGVQLSVGIGLHFGPVIVGRVGHPTRRQFAVIGDSVNVASRIQSMNKSLGTRVLVSESVIDQLPAGGLEIGQAVSTRLRGKQRPVRLHALNGFAELDRFLVVQQTLGRLLDDSVRFADRFYPRLFAAEPELEALFVNGVAAQGEMLEHMLRGVVFALGRPNQLALGLHTLGANHIGYGVEARHYDVFRQAMLDTIEDALGDDAADPDIAEAWGTTIDMILNLMKSGVES